MCKCASFVITRGPKVWWSKLSDSHEEIIREFKLNQDGVRGPNIVRIEISPVKNNLSLPLKTWVYSVDQDEIPEWYDKDTAEKECRSELIGWAKQKLSGWLVDEAFNPVNPLKINREPINKARLKVLVKKWASVENSVRDSVGASVWDSVGASVENSVRDSVWDSVGASVWDSVWGSVWDSVRDSVWAYTGGLFPNITTWKYAEKLGPDPWRPLLTLWYAGYFPSFDGKVWRLHVGEKAKVFITFTAEEINKGKEPK